MRHARFVFVLLGLTAALVAADPFVGTWNLNGAKSKYAAGKPPKEQTVIIAESGSDLDVTLKGISADGRPLFSHYTVPAGGGQGKIIESPYEAVSGIRIAKNTREISYTKGGKVVLTARSMVSPNGKTVTVTVKGVDMLGKPEIGIAVFDKH